MNREEIKQILIAYKKYNDDEVIIEDNTIYEIDLKSYQKYKDKKQHISKGAD